MTRLLTAAFLVAFLASAVAFWVPGVWHKQPTPQPEPQGKAEMFEKSIPLLHEPPVAMIQPSGYAKLKAELRDWADIGGKFIPIISLVLAFIVKRRKP